jgi:hypothetical protein
MGSFIREVALFHLSVAAFLCVACDSQPAQTASTIIVTVTIVFRNIVNLLSIGVGLDADKTNQSFPLSSASGDLKSRPLLLPEAGLLLLNLSGFPGPHVSLGTPISSIIHF